MNGRGILKIVGGIVACVAALSAFQKPWKEYPAVEYNNFPLPPDYNVPAEWVFARIMFPGGPLDGYYPRFQGDYRKGLSLWTQDYPRADRHLARAMRRLTRIDVRSVEQVTSLDDDDVFNWPWLYAAQINQGTLTDPMVAKLHEYLDRGGFLYLDDIWGEYVAMLDEVPEERRHLRIHLGHNCWVEPEEERFITKELIERTCLVGTPQQLADTVRGLEAAGLTQIMLLPPLEAKARVLRSVAEQVFPLIQALTNQANGWLQATGREEPPEAWFTPESRPQ
mgnify:CR=1 FL=1